VGIERGCFSPQGGVYSGDSTEQRYHTHRVVLAHGNHMIKHCQKVERADGSDVGRWQQCVNRTKKCVLHDDSDE